MWSAASGADGSAAAKRDMDAEPATGRRGPLLLAGTVLGVGLGGFADGILLHQILQWHNMLSSVIVPDDIVSMKVNMFWDGLFSAMTWFVTVIGLGLLWRASRQTDAVWSGRVLVGALFLGWGLFNVVEGIIDHQLLGLHHVRPGAAQRAWDLAFLASGLLFAVVGWTFTRPGARRNPAPARPHRGAPAAGPRPRP